MKTVVMMTKENESIIKRVQSFIENQATSIPLGKRKKFPWINNQSINR